MTEIKDKQLVEKKAATSEVAFRFKSLEELEAFGDKIAKSGFTPLTKGNQVVAAILTGRELGLPAMFSANNIYPINGRASLGIHAIKKILLENGIVEEVLRDCEPCVSFVVKGDDRDDNGNPLAYLIDKTTGKEVKRIKNDKGELVNPENSIPVFIREGFIDEVARDNEIKGRKITNHKTVIRLTRMLKQPNGSFKEVSMTDSYSTNEARGAVLLDRGAVTGGAEKDKDNWQRFTRQMLYTRAVSLVGKKIADDVLGGLSETTELLDAKNIDYSVNDEGKVTIINEKETKKPNTSNVSDAEEVLLGENTDAPNETKNDKSSVNN